MNQPPRRSADIPVFQITAFRTPRRFQQTPLKSAGSLSSLSPLWFDSCTRSGGLTTEDTEDTEKERLGDGADVHRSKPQAICSTPARRFRFSYIRPYPGAPRVGCCCIADFPVGRARPCPEALRLADRRAGLKICGTAGLETCAPSHGRRDAHSDFGDFRSR